MKTTDAWRLGFRAVVADGPRSLLSFFGVAIGIAAVMLLSAVGEGARVYILEQFTQFGTNLLAINPGKTDTQGIPGVFGGTTQKLTEEDADALRRLPGVRNVLPIAVGQGLVEVGNRGRSINVYGVTADLPEVWEFEVGQGTFVPEGEAHRGAHVVVLGPTVKRELFGDDNALGAFVRIAGERLRVVGVMAPKGQLLGFDLDDAAYVPLRTGMRMFNMSEVTEIDVKYLHESWSDTVVEGIRRTLTARHGGREDFTITTQAAMLEVFDKVLFTVTLAVGAIAGISLFVGAIGILTTLWIAVERRTQEIGLLRAIGATAAQVRSLFLWEAVGISVVGGILGLAMGGLLALGLRLSVPALPVAVPPGFLVFAVVVSLATGLLSGFLPARRAAALTPCEALREE